MALRTKKAMTTGISRNQFVCTTHYGIVIANDDQRDCLEKIRHRDVYIGK